MEAILCLPVLLLVTLGVAQFAHVWLCRTMVHYAAYCGARATLTAAPGQEKAQAEAAVRMVCAPLVYADPSNGADFSLPGIDGGREISESGGVCSNEILTTAVTIENNGFHTRTEVAMYVPLMVPLAGPVIGKAMKLFDGGGFAPQGDSPDGIVTKQIRGDLFPRIRLNGTVWMAKPYLCTWSSN